MRRPEEEHGIDKIHEAIAIDFTTGEAGLRIPGATLKNEAMRFLRDGLVRECIPPSLAGAQRRLPPLRGGPK